MNWLNSVDAGYRTELRDQNKNNFARFDAKLEQRFAEQDAKIEKRFAEQDATLEKRFAVIEVMFERRFGELATKLERGLKDQTRWMFVVWASLLIPIISLWMQP